MLFYIPFCRELSLLFGAIDAKRSVADVVRGGMKEISMKNISVKVKITGGGGKIRKLMKQKKDQINSVGYQHTRVDNNKTNKAQINSVG